MFPYLLLLFTVLPAIELAILIKLGSQIGVTDTLLIIIFTGVLGAMLARYQGFVALQKIQTNMNNGKMPSEELIDGVMILVGGIVLLTPGLITDSMGFLLLIPLTRSFIKIWVKRIFTNMIKNGEGVQIVRFSQTESKKDDDVIDI